MTNMNKKHLQEKEMPSCKENNVTFSSLKSHEVLLNVDVYFLKLCSLPVTFYQPGTKATQSWGNHPWTQVLHWLWGERGKPVHTGCTTGGQNRYGLQGEEAESYTVH